MSAKIDWPDWQAMPFESTAGSPRTPRNEQRRLIRVDCRSQNGTSLGGTLAPLGVSFQLVYLSDLPHIMAKVPDDASKRRWEQAEEQFAGLWAQHLAEVRKSKDGEGLTETAIVTHANKTRNFSVEAEFNQLARRAWDALVEKNRAEGKPMPSGVAKAAFFSGKPLRSVDICEQVIPAPSTPQTEQAQAQKQMADAIADGLARAIAASGKGAQQRG